MIRPLKTTTKYYATTEGEAKTKVDEIKDKSTGLVTSTKIDQKTHKDAGDYFELTVVQTFTSSKDIIESGV